VILLGLVGAAFLSAMIIIDTLPSDLTVIVIVAMAVLLILISILVGRKKRYKRIIGVLLA